MNNLYPFIVEQLMPDGSRILVAHNYAATHQDAIKAADLPDGENYSTMVRYADARVVQPAVEHERFACAVVASIKATDAEEAYRLIERELRGRGISVEYSTNAFRTPGGHDHRETFWHIPEVLWGDGNVNMIDGPRTIRADRG